MSAPESQEGTNGAVASEVVAARKDFHQACKRMVAALAPAAKAGSVLREQYENEWLAELERRKESEAERQRRLREAAERKREAQRQRKRERDRARRERLRIERSRARTEPVLEAMYGMRSVASMRRALTSKGAR